MDNNVPNQYKINISDINKKSTYLGFKKTEALKQLKLNIISGILDRAIFWAVELDLTNINLQLWETICLLASLHVNIKIPNLPNLIYNSYETINNIVKDKTKKQINQLHLYNNQINRNHLIYIVSILTLSPKSNLPKLITWKRDKNISLIHYKSRIHNTDLENINDIVKINDNRLIYVPINEIYNALMSRQSTSEIRDNFIFWLSYVLELEKRHDYSLCAIRSVPNIPEKCKKNICWCVWQIFFKVINIKYTGTPLIKVITNLYKLFRINYVLKRRISRIPYLIHAGLLIIGCVPKIDFSIKNITNFEQTLTACLNCNLLYQKNYYQKINDREDDSNDKEVPNKPILYIPLLK